MTRHRLHCVKRTDAGGRETNEDRYLVYDSTIDSKPVQMRYFVIADGVGISSQDFSAATVAIKEIKTYLNPLVHRKITIEELNDTVRKAIIQANERILKENIARYDELTDKYDTTTIDVCTLYSENDGSFQVTHVGDSRIYVLYKNNEFKKITKDENKAQILADEGTIRNEDVQKIHPQSTTLLNVVGLEKEFEPNVYAPIPIKSIAIILAATDGLYTRLTEKEIENFMIKCRNNKTELKKALEEIFDVAKNNPRGMLQVYMSFKKNLNEQAAYKMLKKDNLTAILIKNGGV